MAQSVRRRIVDEDDIISHYGSISGETFASHRSRQQIGSLRMTRTDLLARNLKEYHAASRNGSLDKQQQQVIQNKDDEIKSISSIGKRFNQSFHHYRFLVAMMGGMSVGCMMVLRYSLTISILRMVNQTHLYLEEHPNRTVEDFLAEGYSLGGDFLWNNEIVAIILSWYMFSYTLPQMPTSRLSAKIGCRLSVPISLTICCISSLLTPSAAYLGWQHVVALRLLNGLGASPVLPMLLNLLEIWMRYDEISFGLSIAQVVNASICALCPLISGYLAAIHWSLAFSVPAYATLVFCALWLVLISDGPESSRFVSEKELAHIQNCEQLDLDASGAHTTQVTTKEDLSVYQASSWTQIFKVPSFYAYVILWCFYCSSFSSFTFILPTYMRQFLKIPVAQNGLYCFIIQLGTIISVLWPHPLLRFLQRKFHLTNTHSRVIAYAICCSMVAATWIYVGAFHDTQLLMLFINRAFHPANDILVTGTLMSNYAKAGLSSMAFSLVNTVGNLSIVGVSTVIGWYLDYSNQSREGWCWVFTGIGLGQLIMFLIFSLFISSDPIKFNKGQQQTQQDPETNRNVATNTQAQVAMK